MSQTYVVLLLGSNMGNRKKNIETALEKIEAQAGRIMIKSRLMETKPVEFVSCNIFCNIALSIITEFSPLELLHILKGIEKEMGRKKDSSFTGQYEDRIIDIDIVTYGGLTFASEKLSIPHRKHLFEREFSKELLADIIENI